MDKKFIINCLKYNPFCLDFVHDSLKEDIVIHK